MKNKITLLLGFLVVLASETVHGEQLVWQDEFDFLDEGKWTHLVTGWDGGNGEFQYYRNNRKNSFVRDGNLFIRPTRTTDEIPDLQNGKIQEPGCNMEPCISVGGGDIINPYFSARLLSRNSFSVQYGRIEIRAKLPSGDWLWPAVWMMPTDDVYGSWPRSGEIDIIESRGNADLRSPDGGSHGNNVVESTLHFGPAWYNKAQSGSSRQAAEGQNYANDFHVYEFIWNADLMKFLVDGQVIHEVNIPEGGFTQIGGLNDNLYEGKNKNAPFDQRFHFILNVAVGGGYFPDNWTSAGRERPWHGGDNRRQFWNARGSWEQTWGSADQQSLQIDYIRVYQ